LSWWFWGTWVNWDLGIIGFGEVLVETGYVGQSLDNTGRGRSVVDSTMNGCGDLELEVDAIALDSDCGSDGFSSDKTGRARSGVDLIMYGCGDVGAEEVSLDCGTGSAGLSLDNTGRGRSGEDSMMYGGGDL